MSVRQCSFVVKIIIKIHRLFPRYSIYWILYGVEEDENMNGLTGKDASSLVKQIEKYLNLLNIKAELEEANIFGFDINMENTMMSVRIICLNFWMPRLPKNNYSKISGRLSVLLKFLSSSSG